MRLQHEMLGLFFLLFAAACVSGSEFEDIPSDEPLLYSVGTAPTRVWADISVLQGAMYWRLITEVQAQDLSNFTALSPYEGHEDECLSGYSDSIEFLVERGPALYLMCWSDGSQTIASIEMSYSAWGTLPLTMNEVALLGVAIVVLVFFVALRCVSGSRKGGEDMALLGGLR